MSKDNNHGGQPVISQLMSFIPRHLLDKAVEEHSSDHYYKEMPTFRHLVFIMYGVITRCNSLNHLIKSLSFLDGKLSHLDINELPARSTLSDANKNRDSAVFGTLYQLLFSHYQSYLSSNHIQMFINGEIDPKRVELFDSTTISLFVDIFKATGRLSMNGKIKGGLKAHTKLPLSSNAPDFVTLSEASKNDKDFLGQLKVEPGQIYVFDKGYVNYKKWHEWTKQGSFYVTRLNDNANYDILTGQPNHLSEYANGGIVADYRIRLGEGEARLVIFKDYVSGKTLQFVTNLFDCEASSIAMIYKCRWTIEVLFKSIKQNFELFHFFADSPEGIKTQIWIVLIANLIFSVVHKQVQECESFSILVGMAANNMGSHISLIKVVKDQPRRGKYRNLEIVQFDLFSSEQGVLFADQNKSP